MQKLYIGESAEFSVCDQKFRVTVHHDSDHGSPWENEDGHGPVTDRLIRDKLPGEMILSNDGRKRRFYSFQEACKIALRDKWGVPAYRVDIEEGENSLKRASGQWFEGRQLLTFKSDWMDNDSAAIADIYKQHAATFPSSRAYAAKAAFADFERLKAWCCNDWEYVGIVVEMLDDEGEPTGESGSLWGIESDSYSHIWDEAHNLAAELIAPQCKAA